MKVQSPPRDAEGFELVASQEQARAIDRAAIDDWKIPGRVLMEVAGVMATRVIRARSGEVAGKAVILCGPGNNGGDGWVVARHLQEAGWVVRVVATAEPAPGTDAHVNFALWQRLGGEIRWAERGATARMKNWLNHANVIVDALFGTGLTRAVEGAAAELIAAANDAEHGLKVALDVPSGLDGDRGAVLGGAFRADVTVTFGLAKTGLYLGAGPAHAGEIVVVSIGWPHPVINAIDAVLRRARPDALATRVPARPDNGHKGTFGHVGVIGGFAGKEGAAILASLGALRAGAGLATWLAPASASAPERPPELMREVLDSGGDGPLPTRPTVLVVGPGLGDEPDILRRVLADPRPHVLDADALNTLAAAPTHVPRAVLTPHPLEAARLLSTDAPSIQADRLAAARHLVAKYHATVVLKGAGTIVAAPDHAPVLIDIADPTLATGGTGDVLAGCIAGLMAQGASPRDAALVGVYVHAVAARDLGEQQARRGVLAHEIANALPKALAALLAGWT